MRTTNSLRKLEKKNLTLSLETKIQSPWENQSLRTTWNYTHKFFFWVLVTPIGFWKKVRPWPCCWNHLLIFTNHFGKILSEKSQKKSSKHFIVRNVPYFKRKKSFWIENMFPKMPFLVHKGRPSKINKRNSFFFFEIRFQWNWIWYACIQGRLLEAIFKRAAQEEVFSWKVHLGWRS